MTITEPPPVLLSDDIRSVAILNRSLPNKESSITADLEKILSLEGTELDSLGAEYCMDGLIQELNANAIYDSIIRIYDSVPGSGLSVFPAQLSWTQVEDICNAYDVDALYVLSFFDTDARVNYRTVPVNVNSPVGNVKTLEHQATVQTLMKVGFRMYDPKNKIILDQYMINDVITNSGRGINPFKAVEAVIGRKQSVLQVSTDLGREYALRVLPYNLRVSRRYFVRGNSDLKKGRRRAETGNWSGAAELWEQNTDADKRKVAGRACYNMAVYAEMNGDLEGAITWASKAYEDYNNKLARDYVRLLNNRLQRRKIASQVQ